MRVVVIGGGIQGSCVGLALARREVAVDLIDAKPALMESTSRHSEGKVHLGYVYANDASLRTAQLQLLGASVFARLMREWLGDEFDAVPVSTGFNYVVHRQSLLSADRLSSIYQQVGQLIDRACDGGAYFGVEHPGRVHRLSKPEAHQFGKEAESVFATQELAVSPDSLADLIVKRVFESEKIKLHLGAMVTAVDPIDRRVAVRNEDGTVVRLGPYDHVVNCAWEGRPAIDLTVGVQPPADSTFRMKYFIKTASDVILPSSTIVLGPFGDIVQYEDGDQYLCWYPSGRVWWSEGPTPPKWPTRPQPDEAMRITKETLAFLSDVVPAVAGVPLDSGEVRGGVICAPGQSDVDDPNSQLHERWNIGPTTRYGWYHSVDTGKYTTAPLFATQVADRIAASDD